MTDTKPSFAAQIDRIMETFDFAEVARVMGLMNWTWWHTHPNTPTVEQLRELALDLLNGVVGGYPNITGSRSGGLCASVDQWGILSLDFIPESCDASVLFPSP